MCACFQSDLIDTGVYYCNATNPVTGVSAISRNATLQIASKSTAHAQLPAVSRYVRQFPRLISVAAPEPFLIANQLKYFAVHVYIGCSRLVNGVCKRVCSPTVNQ